MLKSSWVCTIENSSGLVNYDVTPNIALSDSHSFLNLYEITWSFYPQAIHFTIT